jgi:hypothetical protein
MTHEELDDIMDKSNDDEDIIFLEFTQLELETMLQSVKDASAQGEVANIDFNTIHDILLTQAKSISNGDNNSNTSVQLHSIVTHGNTDANTNTNTNPQTNPQTQSIIFKKYDRNISVV